MPPRLLKFKANQRDSMRLSTAASKDQKAQLRLKQTEPPGKGLQILQTDTQFK